MSSQKEEANDDEGGRLTMVGHCGAKYRDCEGYQVDLLSRLHIQVRCSLGLAACGRVDRGLRSRPNEWIRLSQQR